MRRHTIKRIGRTCAPVGGEGFGAAVESVMAVLLRFWGHGMCRYSLFLALELAPAPGMASPVLGGDSAVLLRVRLEAGVWGVCGGR